MKKKNKAAMEQQLFPLNKLITESISHLVAKQFSFVLFKLPFSSKYQLIVQQEVPEAQQFCLHSFDNKEHIVIKGNLYENEEIIAVKQLQNEQTLARAIERDDVYMPQKEYEAYVRAIINSIERGELSKCVAARKKKIKLKANFELASTFLAMAAQYDSAFCYLANTTAGLWMGASPELLLRKKENQYFTVALAGTKLAAENREWTTKEIEEHQFVVDYIKETIQQNGIEELNSSPVFDGGSGHLLHLKMDINFTATKSIHEALHPTPAVCGIPVDKAKAFILQHEFANRSLYAGYLGLEGANACYYVNLRCMQIFEDYAVIYIGAGITAGSDPEKEWIETENKSLIMGKLLQSL